MKPFTSYRMGSWNVMSLTDTAGRQDLLAVDLHEKRMDLVALQSLNIPGEGNRSLPHEYHLFWSGYSEGRRSVGVGFALRRKLVRVATFRPISDRVSTLVRSSGCGYTGSHG